VFQIRIHVFHHLAPTAEEKLDRILGALINLRHAVQKEEHTVSAELDALTAQVHENSSVVDSALTLIRGLQQRLQDAITAGSDPATLQALADELKAKDDILAAAVAANTAPAPTV